MFLDFNSWKQPVAVNYSVKFLACNALKSISILHYNEALASLIPGPLCVNNFLISFPARSL